MLTSVAVVPGDLRMRWRAIVLFAVLAVVAAGCGYNTITPPGASPLRFRDSVFSGVTKTSDITYGSAVDQRGAHRR